MHENDFGEDIRKPNNWLDKDIQSVGGSISDTLQKAKAIYYYVKNNIKCTNYKTMWLSQPLKDIYKSRSGSIADVNILLTTMLRHENIKADPVILSTRSNGWAHAIYPLLSNYNYVICKVNIGNNNYYLDASQPEIGFNHLPSELYNGDGMQIGDYPVLTTISPDVLDESKTTHILLFNDEKKPGKWDGNFESQLGYNESGKVRETLKKKGNTEYEKSITKSDFDFSEFEYDNKDSLEKPLTIKCKIAAGTENNPDIIYFNPMITEAVTANPFKSAVREYPVEMPYRIDQKYFLSIEIPKGYMVDEMPGPTKALLNNDEGIFEYNISKNDNNEIDMICHIKLDKANFAPEDYDALRNFYGLIVKKENEQIVFKKINK
ncbi:MAG: transglutaminase-like domain-containing protein [Ferruginibacter sp.]